MMFTGIVEEGGTLRQVEPTGLLSRTAVLEGVGVERAWRSMGLAGPLLSEMRIGFMSKPC